MPKFSRGSRSEFFLHIPKTGGSSVEAAFLEVASVSWVGNGDAAGACSLQHMHLARVHDSLGEEGADEIWAIVRNPADRFLSEFSYRKRHRRLVLHHYVGVTGFALACQWLFRADPYALDNHLRPQVEFLGPEVTVYRFEEGVDSVIASRMLELTGEVYSGGHHKKRSLAKEKEVTNVTRRVIEEMYHQDFEQIGYRWPESIKTRDITYRELALAVLEACALYVKSRWIPSWFRLKR